MYKSTRITENKVFTADEFTCTNSGFGIHGLIVKCPTCELIYIDESYPQSEISAYYEIAQDSLYFLEQPARVNTFNRYLKRIEDLKPYKGRLLDVGTNTGLFVKLAADRGWEAVGLEPNKWGVEYAKKNYGVEIINKAFDKNLFAKESFDVITMWDVIEHFTDPIAELKKVYGYLKPQGMFAFSTVDPLSLFAKIMGTRWPWYMEMHRAFFSRASADYYLKRLGFRKVIFKPHFRNLSLSYLTSRVAAVFPIVSKMSTTLVNITNAGNIVVPYYANDLYDCYAIK